MEHPYCKLENIKHKVNLVIEISHEEKIELYNYITGLLRSISNMGEITRKYSFVTIDNIALRFLDPAYKIKEKFERTRNSIHNTVLEYLDNYFDLDADELSLILCLTERVVYSTHRFDITSNKSMVDAVQSIEEAKQKYLTYITNQKSHEPTKPLLQMLNKPKRQD